jgi:hypothetical protein
MKFLDIEQRTEAWDNARLGKPTASQFDRIIGERTTKTGITRSLKPEGAKTYEAQLLAERIFKVPFGPNLSENRAVQYGVEREPEARHKLEEELGIGTEILPGGFFTTDDGRIGASPDGRVLGGNIKELVEIKCPQVPQHIKTMLYGPDDYMAQIQGQLFISGYDLCHFYSWRHDCPPVHLRIEPDLAYFRDLERLLAEFCERLDEHHRALARMDGWKP